MSSLNKRHLYAALLLFMHFPVWMGLYVWLTESVGELRGKLSSGGMREISAA